MKIVSEKFVKRTSHYKIALAKTRSLVVQFVHSFHSWLVWGRNQVSTYTEHVVLPMQMAYKLVHIMLLACHNKSYLKCVKFSKYYVIFILIFFHLTITKLRHPTGLRQLLEILRNNSKIRHISNSFSYDMPVT
jgi:hypothetical protein